MTEQLWVLLFVGVIYSFHLEVRAPGEFIIGNTSVMMDLGRTEKQEPEAGSYTLHQVTV